MIKIASKYNVRFDAINPTEELKDALPLWRHFALPDEDRLVMSKSVRCLLTAHGVIDVGQACRAAARLHSVGASGAHRPAASCQCVECAVDQAAGCDNPHRCAMAARRMLNKLLPRWTDGPPCLADGLSLTVRRKQANSSNALSDGRVTFDPSITARLPLAAHFRVFEPANAREIVPVSRPTRGVSIATEEVEVFTDGSCNKNGSHEAVAAGGVWFGPRDVRNTASLVTGAIQSNQSAELFAVGLAVASVPPFAPLHIVTD
ncbi:hypothetical protein C8T65DRAFT_545511, partial [Cerioporus squamosus]